MWLRIGKIAFGVLASWASLAQIAPDIFQLKREQMTGWLFLVSPTMAWILLPVVVIGFLWYIDKKFDNVDRNLSDMSTQSDKLKSLLEDVEKSIPWRERK